MRDYEPKDEIEKGIVDGPELESVASGYLEPLMRQRIDAVVLGCTDCHGGNPTPGLSMRKAHVEPRSMQRQPKLSIALVRALSSSDVGVTEGGAEVRRLIASMAGPILADFDDVRLFNP